MAIVDITNSTTRYTVVRGDTFSAIAQRCIQVNMSGYSGLSLYNAGINKLKSFNPDIENVNLISVGQVIILQGSPAPKTKSVSQKARVTNFGLLSSGSTSIFATWAWDKTNVDYYEIKWVYDTDLQKGIIESQPRRVNIKQDIFGIPEGATSIKFYVRPVSTTYNSGNKKIKYWVAEWSTVKTYAIQDAPPLVPPVPADSDITVDNLKLTVTLNNLDTLNLNATHIEFQILRDTNNSVFSAGTIKIDAGKVSYSAKLEAGKEYRVRCRSIRGTSKSEWSARSNAKGTAPSATDGIYSLYALTNSSVSIRWYDVSGTDTYEVQYANNVRYFDSSNQVTSENTNVSNAIINVPETGREYFFRVRALKEGVDASQSPWSEIKSIQLGTTPAAPTTWSSTTNVTVGDPLTLYWMHNSTDASHQTETILETTINGITSQRTMIYGDCESTNETASKTVTIQDFASSDLVSGAIIRVYMLFANNHVAPTLNIIGALSYTSGVKSVIASDPFNTYWEAGSLITFRYNGTYWEVINKTSQQSISSYSIDTNDYSEGTKILWKVKTAGLLKNNDEYIFSDWSVQREVDIYAPPTLSIDITNSSGTTIEELTSFPMNISVIAGPSTQKVTGYFVNIKANNSYETVDSIGNNVYINEGTVVYSKYFNANSNSNTYTIPITASDVNLENNIEYTITCIASMNSGLNAEASSQIMVTWTDDEYWPDAEVGYDSETYTTVIKPFCVDEDNELISGITLSVYRIEFDGKFTELATGLNNSQETYITDPHPSLSIAKYRIIATVTSTGAVSFYDIPGYPINETSVILQWNETWKPFIYTGSETLESEELSWSGSMIKLPYNIDIADTFTKDKELIKYIGREHPVSYYGTQLSHSSTWNVVIDKTDEETLYTLRKLASWTGDVYVREPSGSGYWANVEVSFSKTHLDLTIPITLEITRVEGGI